MQKNPISQSGLFNPRVLFAFILCSGSALLAILGMAAPSSSDPAGKIASWVLEHTVNGSQAEFLVVLSDQADLSGAARLQTKGEKGRYVRDILWNKAQVTQGPLLQWLSARNIDHRSYYIVNM